MATKSLSRTSLPPVSRVTLAVHALSSSVAANAEAKVRSTPATLSFLPCTAMSAADRVAAMVLDVGNHLPSPGERVVLVPLRKFPEALADGTLVVVAAAPPGAVRTTSVLPPGVHGVAVELLHLLLLVGRENRALQIVARVLLNRPRDGHASNRHLETEGDGVVLRSLTLTPAGADDARPVRIV